MMSKKQTIQQKTNSLALLMLAAGVSAVMAGITWWANPSQPIQTPPTPAPAIIQSISLTPFLTGQAGECKINGVLPDKNCTPGSIDPRVTQENIQQTICVSGYSGKVRPSATYTNKLKIQQIKEYGYADTNPKIYEEDHLISLELGGNSTDPRNLWPEPGGAPNPKDKIENLCHKKVCNGQISLADAQKQIATNWPTACK